MRIRVTAILVAQKGGAWLDETVAGIRRQTAAPATIVAVNNGGGSALSEQLMESGVHHVVGLTSRVSFGRAVAQAAAQMRPVSEPADGTAEDALDEWLWLLTEDSCPEPAALEMLSGRVQRAPSVVVAGPKLVDWDSPERIVELGQSLTRGGARWALRRDELDQQQYDHMQDVLAVGPVGMLVRRDVWDQLGGFDPALPVYDDGLDFCVRARLAGHRVEVAPEARIRFARSGVAGPRIDRSRSVLRAAHRQSRISHLHRRIAYDPAPIAFLEWLFLPITAVLRVMWALIREQPGNMFAEFTAPFTVFFKPHALIASRRRIRRDSRLGWSAVRDLRVDPKTVRTARIIDREAILASLHRHREEMHFISSGGLAVLTTALVLGIVLTWWALPQTSLFGGGITPLSSLDELWWNTRIIDGVPSDPFTWILALLGTATFWNPSYVLVLLLIVSVPLAALGAWVWSAGLTASRAGRVLVGIAYGVSPVLLGAVATGRISGVVLAIVLPWLFVAGVRARESWSWAGTASLLAGIALAAAPVLIPAAVLMLLVGAFSSFRGTARVLTVALVPAVLFAPLVVTALLDGRPINALLDPGIVLPYEPGTMWHMLLGFPEFGLEGWGDMLQAIGFGGPPATLVVGIMLAPLALLSLAGLFTGRLSQTIPLALTGGLGMITAIGSTHLEIATIGRESVALWTGSGLAVYWLAVLGLGALGAQSLRSAAPAVVAVALAGAMVAIAPAGWHLAAGSVPFVAGDTQMPAIVRAAGEANPSVKTLMITANEPGVVSARLVVGEGTRLDQVRTARERPARGIEDQRIAELAGGLASAGGDDISAELRRENIGFVLLTESGSGASRAQLQRVFDQNPAIVSSGDTSRGLLWRVVEDAQQEDRNGNSEQRLEGTSVSGHTLWVAQIVILLGVALLALPTGEVTWRPEKRRRQPRRSPRKGRVAAEQTASDAESGNDEEVHA